MMQNWNAGCQWLSKQSGASALPSLNTKLLKMKTKKSAASAALKTTDNKSVSSAPISPASAPKIAARAPSSTVTAPKSAPTAPKATPSAAKPTSVAPKKPTAEALTTIEVKIDVGFGNAIFLRGQGSGLTWEQGVPLDCVDGNTWRWTQKVAGPVTFKVLLNDQVWSAGSDFVVEPGQKVEVSPSFA
jgi:hypothetical protein